MTRQFKPVVSIALAGSGGQNGETLVSYANGDGLKIEFDFESHTSQSPAACQIVIYNISQAKAAKVKAEFNQITLIAGFPENAGEIFKGSIIETQYGERVDNFTSTILRIYAISNDLAYGNASLNEALPAGWTHQDVIDRSAKSLAKYGVPMGQVLGVNASAIRHPRPAVLVGMVRDILRDTCLTLGATWTMNGGQLDVISTKHPGTGSSGVTLSADNGMLGQAILRLDGVNVSCLINPRIKLNTTIKVKSRIISPTLFPNALATQNTFNIAEYAREISPSGDFRVVHIRAHGDTRGADFEMNLTLAPAGGGLNQTQLGLNYQ